MYILAHSGGDIGTGKRCCRICGARRIATALGSAEASRLELGGCDFRKFALGGAHGSPRLTERTPAHFLLTRPESTTTRLNNVSKHASHPIGLIGPPAPALTVPRLARSPLHRPGPLRSASSLAPA